MTRHDIKKITDEIAEDMGVLAFHVADPGSIPGRLLSKDQKLYGR